MVSALLPKRRGNEDGAKRNWAGSSPSLMSCNFTWHAPRVRHTSEPWHARPACGRSGRTSTMAPGLGVTFGPVALDVPTMTVSTQGGAQVEPAEVERFMDSVIRAGSRDFTALGQRQ